MLFWQDWYISVAAAQSADYSTVKTVYISRSYSLIYMWFRSLTFLPAITCWSRKLSNRHSEEHKWRRLRYEIAEFVALPWMVDQWNNLTFNPEHRRNLKTRDVKLKECENAAITRLGSILHSIAESTQTANPTILTSVCGGGHSDLKIGNLWPCFYYASISRPSFKLVGRNGSRIRRAEVLSPIFCRVVVSDQLFILCLANDCILRRTPWVRC